MKRKIMSMRRSKKTSKVYKKSFDILILFGIISLLFSACTVCIGGEEYTPIPIPSECDIIEKTSLAEETGLNDYDREPMPEALEAIESDENVTVTEEEDDLDRISFDPVGVDPLVGMVFGAGGDVDPRAYAPAARTIAEEGYFVVLFYPGVGMPDGGPFGDVIDNYPEIENWTVGGHSNGGMNACEYFDDEEPDGLHLWAAYPNPGFIGIGETDLSDKEGEFVSIYATNDGVTTVDDIEDSEERLPEDTEFVEIEGGNHAQFGWYGEQDGDNEADISREEQQALTINATLDHLDEIRYEVEYDLIIDVEEGGTTDPEPGIHHYSEDEEVIIHAESYEGWEFSHWSGDVDSTDKQVPVDMDEDKSITAHFVEDGLETMDIHLYDHEESGGWNFVSFNLDLEDNELEALLEHEDHGISGNYDKLMYYDSVEDGWQSFIPNRAEHFNTIDTWNHKIGLWIQMTEEDTLTVEGTEPTSTEIILQPGWNMVSYPSETARVEGTPEEVSIVGYFDAARDNNLAYDYEPDNFEFEPGQGYWLHNEAAEPAGWTVDY